MYFIGVIIMFAGILFTFYLKGAPLAILVNPAAVLLIIFTIIGVIASTSNFKTFIRGVGAIISPKYVIDDEERERAAELNKLLSRSVIVASFICSLIAVISILGNIGDVEIMAHASASAIVAPIIGLSVSLLFFEPAVYVLKRPRKKAETVKKYSKHSGNRLLEMCRQSGMTEEDIANATSIKLKKD